MNISITINVTGNNIAKAIETLRATLAVVHDVTNQSAYGVVKKHGKTIKELIINNDGIMQDWTE
jgi:hypothetical protein